MIDTSTSYLPDRPHPRSSSVPVDESPRGSDSTPVVVATQLGVLARDVSERVVDNDHVTMACESGRATGTAKASAVTVG